MVTHADAQVDPKRPLARSRWPLASSTMRRLVVLGSLSGLTACHREAPAAEDPPAAGSKVDAAATAVEGKAEVAEAFDPAAPGIPLDDANRFVWEDLVRFMADFPDALREQDRKRIRVCRGDGCVPELGRGITPYHGAGIRYLVPLWLRGCLTGSAQSCLLAGRSYQSSALELSGDEPTTHIGWTKEALQDRFRRYIARACDLSATHCESWADFLLGDTSPPKQDVARAIDRLKAGCERSEPGSCAALARHADRYPAIGDAGAWWRQACEHAARVPSAECTGYAQHLMESGAASEAEAVLGPICDPSSSTWKSNCPGDPADASEACDPVYFHIHATPCVGLAKSLPPDDALRLYSAFCVASLITETTAAGRKACTEAARLAERLGRSAEYRETLRRRTCEVTEMECLDVEFDIIACGEQRERCVEAG